MGLQYGGLNPRKPICCPCRNPQKEKEDARMSHSPTLTIEKLVYGGDGLGRLEDGRVLFVPQSAPGDEVAVIVDPKAKPPQGHIRQIISPSAERRDPPCSVFERCGGCQWQHLSGESQLDWKRKIVEETFARIGKISQPAPLEVIRPTEWHYRNKVQWMVRDSDPESPMSKPELGYFAKRSHDIVSFDHCWIIPESLNGLADWFRANMPAKAGVNEIEARLNRAGDLLIIFSGRPLLTDLLLALPEPLKEAYPNLVGMVAKTPKKTQTLWRQGYLTETIGETTFKVSADSFFQVNHAMLDEMIRILDGWLPEKTSSFLDLYCGVGTFGLHFRERAHRVVGVESAPASVTDAERNQTTNHATNFHIHAGDVRYILRRIEDTFNVTLLDPPRAGCHPEVLDWVNAHTSEQIIYISCNPATMARDLKHLCDAGWRVETIQPMDMFPQTYHIEVMVRLFKG